MVQCAQYDMAKFLLINTANCLFGKKFNLQAGTCISQYQYPRALKRHRQGQHHRIKMANVVDACDAICGDFDIVWTRTT